MDFDWSKPMLIDWSGRSGPLFTEQALENCVIKRIVNNTYCAPFCEKKYVREIPKWNPRYLHGWNNRGNYRRFIPGDLPLPAYPQVSTLNHIQHQQGVRVLSTKYENVQPHHFKKPSKMDHLAFQEIKELYETEQKEYLQWAKLLWLNGGCIQALRPKPIIEQVYEAEFKMRAHEVKSWPQNFVLAAQIPLETNKDSFELEHKANLLNINVQDLPVANYPKVMEKTLSILLKSCPMPEPCLEHICKFMLPHEDSMSSLPLYEIHRELANFAISNDCSVIASENALQCLLEPDRKWHIPVSVIQVAGPEHGDTRSIVVLGNEFAIQKTCAAHRTYRAYKHLLRETFAPTTGQHDHQQNANAKTTKPVNVTNIEVSNKEVDCDKRLLDSSEPKQLVDETIDSDPEVNNVDDDHQEYNFNESDDDSSDTDRLIIADPVETIAEPSCRHDASEPNYSNNVFNAPGCGHVDRSRKFYSQPSTSKGVTPVMFETNNDDNITLLKANKNTSSESDKANQGDVSRLIGMYKNAASKSNDANLCVAPKSIDKNTASKSNEAYQGVAPRLIGMDKNTASKSKEASQRVAPRLIETDKNIASKSNETYHGVAPRLIGMDKKTASKSNEANQGVAPRLLTMDKNTVLKSNETYQGVAPRLIGMDKNTASKSNETNQGVAPSLLEIDKNIASKSNDANQGVAPRLLEMDKNIASKSNDPNQGVAPRLIGMDKSLTPRLFKTSNVRPYSLETNIDHTSQTKKLETSTRDCSNKPETGHGTNKVSSSPAEQIPHINPSLIETMTCEPTYSNKLIASGTNTSEVSTRITKRKLSDSESYSEVKEAITTTNVAATGMANNSGNRPNSKEPVSTLSAGKKVRSLLDQVYLEHNYFQLRSETPESTESPLLSVNNSNASSVEADSDQPSPGDDRLLFDDIDNIPKPGVRKLCFSTPISKSETPNSTDPKPVRNVEYNKPKTSAKSKSGKINFSELFGDESDSEEPIHNTSYSFNNATEEKKNNSSHDLENLASSEPQARISEYSMSISGSDIEDGILGFHQDVAVPITQQKSSKESKIKQSQRNTFSRIHTLRCRKKTKHETNSKNKKVPHVKNKISNDVRSGWNSCSISDESDYSMTDTKHNVALRRSRRLSTRMQVEESDDPHKKNTNKQSDSITKNAAIRRSQRLSTRLQAEESDAAPKMKSNEQKDTKTKNDASRSQRLSTRLQAEENDDSYKKKSNDQKDTKTKNVALRRSRRLSTRLQADEGDDQIDTETKNVALKRSRRLSTRLQAEEGDDPFKMKTNDQIDTKTKNVALRRSRRLSTRLQAEEGDDQIDAETKNVALKRSRRLSTRLQAEEGDDPFKMKTNDQIDAKTKNVALRSQRLSTRLQAEENDDSYKKKSNDQKDTKTKKVALRRSRRLSTRLQAEESKAIEQVTSLDLSERSKRYLRRTLNFESSDTEQESEKKFPRGSLFSACSSDSESNAVMNIFHFTMANDTDSDDSDSENSLTIDCPQQDCTEKRQSTDISGDKTRETERMITSNSENSLAIDCPQLDYTEKRQVKDISGDKTRETERMITSRTEYYSLFDEPSTTIPVTLQPQVETKKVDATRTLHETQVRTNESSSKRTLSSSEQLLLQNERLKNANTLSREAVYDIIGVDRCSCKDTNFDVPPPRSFKKWQVKNKTTNGAFDIIVHSSHKVRKGENEVLLEPIVEFQPDLGGTRQSEGKIRALTLSLMMRPFAQLVNVRVNHESGEVIVIEEMSNAEWIDRHGDRRADLAGTLHTALGQLRYLLPGQYVLAHDMSHGSNAMLYTTKGLSSVHESGYSGQKLNLRCDNINMPDAEEAMYANTPPDLAPVLLPYHKSRGMLPLAFTPQHKYVKAAKKITAALAKVKLPPHGIKWPKKKKKKSRKPRQDRQPQAHLEPEI